MKTGKERIASAVWQLGAAVGVVLGASAAATAAPVYLTTGTGEGSLTVGVDAYGAFGSSVGTESDDALYDPVGPIQQAGTMFESGVALQVGTSGTRQFLTVGLIGSSGGLPNVAVSATSTSATSTFTVGSLRFNLTQTLQPQFQNNQRVGARLSQTYSITNIGTAASSFHLVRYIDGDLQFDGSISDGGGRLVTAGTEFLFETDTATGALDPTTFLGITGTGGTHPGTGRYEADSYSALRQRIIDGIALDQVITGDGPDPDQFVDAGNGYDITLALRNNFNNIGPGQTATYTTLTVFGTGAPTDVPEPAAAGLLAVGAMLSLRRRARG